MLKRMMLIGSVFVILCSGCGKKEKMFIEDNKNIIKEQRNIQTYSTKQVSESGLDEQTSIDKKDIIQINKKSICESNIKGINDVVSYTKSDISIDFSIKEIEYSKKFLGEEFDEYAYNKVHAMNAVLEENGNLLDDSTYVFITIEVINRGVKTQWNPLDFPILVIENDLTLSQTGDDGPFLVYAEGIKGVEKDSFYVELDEKEKKKVVIGFWMKDNLLKRTLGYFISPNAGYIYPDDNSFIVNLGKKNL